MKIINRFKKVFIAGSIAVMLAVLSVVPVFAWSTDLTADGHTIPEFPDSIEDRDYIIIGSSNGTLKLYIFDYESDPKTCMLSYSGAPSDAYDGRQLPLSGKCADYYEYYECSFDSAKGYVNWVRKYPTTSTIMITPPNPRIFVSTFNVYNSQNDNYIFFHANAEVFRNTETTLFLTSFGTFVLNFFESLGSFKVALLIFGFIFVSGLFVFIYKMLSRRY